MGSRRRAHWDPLPPVTSTQVGSGWVAGARHGMGLFPTPEGHISLVPTKEHGPNRDVSLDTLFKAKSHYKDYLIIYMPLQIHYQKLYICTYISLYFLQHTLSVICDVYNY